MIALNGVKYVKIVKNCQIFAKNVTKHKDWKYYLEYILVRKKDLEKFMLSLKKGVMCYQYNKSWKKCNKKSLPAEENLPSKLNNR